MFKVLRTVLIVFALTFAAGAIWYSRLDKSKKRAIRNFVSQIPALPGRYMI